MSPMNSLKVNAFIPLGGFGNLGISGMVVIVVTSMIDPPISAAVVANHG